jgi:ribosome maturation factor RimP
LERSEITKHVAEIAAKVATEAGAELVHVETAGTKRDMVVRVFIDKEGGVTLGDCSTVSRGIEDVLDAEDFIPSKYVLEVSSPGIERELYSLADFVKFTGELAKVKTSAEIDGQRNFVGRIVAVDGDRITMDDRTRGEVSFDYSAVSKANLKIDLSKEFGHK